MSDDFDRMYSKIGRASTPPERLLKALLLISLYSIRSERAFCQELDYNPLDRWFLDMDLMEPSFDVTVFTKNRRKLLRHKVGRKLFEEVAHEADQRGLMSDEHFSVDGTLIEAAASIRRRDDDGESNCAGDGGSRLGDFRGEKLSNATHQSTTDPRGETDEEGCWQGGKAGVHDACAHGQQAWAGERLPADRGERHGRAGRGAGDADTDTWESSTECVSRQGIRHRGGGDIQESLYRQKRSYRAIVAAISR